MTQDRRSHYKCAHLSIYARKFFKLSPAAARGHFKNKKTNNLSMKIILVMLTVIATVSIFLFSMYLTVVFLHRKISPYIDHILKKYIFTEKPSLRRIIIIYCSIFIFLRFIVLRSVQ